VASAPQHAGTHQLENTLVRGYTRLASDAPPRRIDAELRALDVLLASLFGLLALPFALVIALIALVTSGRPVFYRGERVGRRGRFFQMLKFRTMQAGAEERIGHHLGADLMDATHAELTPLGRWLKTSQLDEIPQLWNVLRGDMSFVGPRPIRPRFFAHLAEDLPAGSDRLRAGASRLRDLDGREARARPRMDRRPLGAPLPPHGLRHRLPRASPDAHAPSID